MRKKVRPPRKNTYLNSCITLPTLIFFSEIGMQLPENKFQQVKEARRSYCTFQGLVRWFRRSVSDFSQGAHMAFDSLAEDRSGQMLLHRLNLLPPSSSTGLQLQQSSTMTSSIHPARTCIGGQTNSWRNGTDALLCQCTHSESRCLPNPESCC